MNRENIIIETINNEMLTVGLKPILDKELRLSIGKHSLEDYKHVLNYLIDFIIKESPTLIHGQKIAYYSWLLRIDSDHSLYYNISEAEKGGDGFIDGVEYAASILKSQINICNEYSTKPVFPTFGQKIALSKGVLEGMDVQAVRYNSPPHMSGWYLTTDLYDGDISNIDVVDFYTLSFARPDFLKFLALPAGFRFGQVAECTDIWFDEELSKDLT